MERSARVAIGCLLLISILPPRCNRKVRSETLIRVKSGTARTAALICSACSTLLADTVISRTVWLGVDSTISTAPIIPPTAPIAAETLPNMPGCFFKCIRNVMLYASFGVLFIDLFEAPNRRASCEVFSSLTSNHRKEQGRIGATAGSFSSTAPGALTVTAPDRRSAFVLQHVQAGVPIRDIDQPIGRDQNVGSLRGQRDVGTRIDQLFRRRGHPVTNFFRRECVLN